MARRQESSAGVFQAELHGGDVAGVEGGGERIGEAGVGRGGGDEVEAAGVGGHVRFLRLAPSPRLSPGGRGLMGGYLP